MSPLTLSVLVGVAILFHLILPPLVLFWMFRARSASKLAWFSIAFLAGSLIVMLWLAGAAWDFFGFHWATLFLSAFLFLFAYGARARWTLPWLPAKRFRNWIGPAITSALGLFFFLAIPPALQTRLFPAVQAIELGFPLKGGTFHVSHGGSHAVTNMHNAVRAQTFALDIVKLNGYGTKAVGLYPSELGKYEVFGAVVVAPCSGEVLAVEGSLPDQAPMQMNKDNLMGNHIVLHCGDATILLAHLQHDSVTIKAGEKAERGAPVARVGNTGNTSEPHLHIHAVAGRQTESKVIVGTGEPLPILFDGRFLVRNDRFRSD